MLRTLGGDELIERLLLGMNLGAYGTILAVLLIVFVLGFVLDWIQIILIILPLVGPIIGVDIVGWLCRFRDGHCWRDMRGD